MGDGGMRGDAPTDDGELRASGDAAGHSAERMISGQAFATGRPGFVGVAVDLPAGAGLPVGSRLRLRHGFLVARSARRVTVSGPPSPGLESCLDRMAEDLAHAATTAILVDARPGESDPAAGGIRIGVEAGLDGPGPLGLDRRWRLAHTVAPVLAAAFANTPSPDGWRSSRQARHRNTPASSGLDPRASWTAYAMDAPGPDGLRLREWTRPPTEDEVRRHLDSLRPAVAARGHLEIDAADQLPGDGWRIVVAVLVMLLDDPVAATAAETATAPLAYAERVWERAARDALSDPELAAAAREIFPAAYAALARRGAPRDLRDAVADFTERYVMRGRCPADDVLAPNA